MADKSAEIINYLIGAGLMTYLLMSFKRKSAANPQMKISGMSMKTVFTLMYFALAIDGILIVMALMK